LKNYLSKIHKLEIDDLGFYQFEAFMSKEIERREREGEALECRVK